MHQLVRGCALQRRKIYFYTAPVGEWLYIAASSNLCVHQGLMLPWIHLLHISDFFVFDKHSPVHSTMFIREMASNHA